MNVMFGKNDRGTWMNQQGANIPVLKYMNDVPKIINAIRLWIKEGKCG